MMPTVLPGALARDRDTVAELAALDRALGAGMIDGVEHHRRLTLLLHRSSRPMAVTKHGAAA